MDTATTPYHTGDECIARLRALRGNRGGWLWRMFARFLIVTQRCYVRPEAVDVVCSEKSETEGMENVVMLIGPHRVVIAVDLDPQQAKASLRRR